MSMSTHVVGFRPPDEKWRKMKAVWDACAAANTLVPKDVVEFFEAKEPDNRGVEVEIKNAVAHVPRDMVDGYEVDITKLPKGATVIRFENRY